LVDPARHPLAVTVHRWTITNQITWPIFGKAWLAGSESISTRWWRSAGWGRWLALP
jgi:hypothetical protein